MLMVAGTLMVAVGIFVLGAVFGTPLRETVTQTPSGSLPEQVTDVIVDRYRGPVDRQKLERIGAKAIADSLGDPYTSYLTPEEYARLKRASDGEYTGVGIRVRQTPQALVVREVFPASPAAAAGVKAGDRIVAVGGVPVARRGPLRSVEAILGKAGTPVVLRVRSGTTPERAVRVTRGDVTVPMIESRMLTAPRGPDVGVIVLNRFESGAGDEVGDTARRLIGDGARALVLDLRGDPGGLLDEAVSVAGVFLPKGDVVVSTRGRASPERVFKADGDPIPADIPVAVLVDGQSASASEIVAGALKDQGRAVVVGTPTFGKSKVQVTQATRDGGAVRVTIAGYLTPKGTDIGTGGVVPQVRASDSAATEPDEALDRAVAVVRAKAG
jgi:carboxyl-terminal processing protease